MSEQNGKAKIKIGNLRQAWHGLVCFRWVQGVLALPLAKADLFACEVKHGKLMRLGLLPLGVLLCGCAFKEPTIIYKEKLTPVRCNAVMPDKPNNDGSFEAHKAKMIYFLKCEDLLKQCIGIADGK